MNTLETRKTKNNIIWATNAHTFSLDPRHIFSQVHRQCPRNWRRLLPNLPKTSRTWRREAFSTGNRWKSNCWFVGRFSAVTQRCWWARWKCSWYNECSFDKQSGKCLKSLEQEHAGAFCRWWFSTWATSCVWSEKEPPSSEFISFSLAADRSCYRTICYVNWNNAWPGANENIVWFFNFCTGSRSSVHTSHIPWDKKFKKVTS